MSAKDQIIHVTGFAGCPYFDKAVELAEKLKEEKGEEVEIKVEKLIRDDFHDNRKKILTKLNHKEDYHTTCPMVYTTIRNQPQQLIGGYDAFRDLVKVEYKVGV